ncbi:MAG: SUMF1/EgtB/PvdO family nonheme iron enzyme [Spirochaetes bacterium]|nr:SUMF1/EgtB/PvdO family nonheme iron enzyme [Spirochaetota bacterium]
MKQIISITFLSVFLSITVAITGCKKTSESFNPLLLLGGNTATAPEAPGAATVTPGDTELSLDWTAVAGATAYEVWFSSTNDSGTALQDEGDIVGTTHVIDGLSNGAPYYIWLKAKNDAGTSDFGPGASGTPHPAPGAPAAAVVDSAEDSLVLTWTAVDGATAYEVWYGTTNDSSSATQSGGDITGTSHTIWSLTNYKPYYIWLKAKNDIGTSGFGPGVAGMPVYKDTWIVGGVGYKIVLVPVGAGMTFHTGTADGDTASLSDPYWIAETEVTYELWSAVYDWAIDTSVDHDGDGLTSDADGDDDVYDFANAGTQGDGTGDTDQHPVTGINWRDAMIWCNALTEYYNATYSSYTLDCVYFTDSGYTTPIRSVDGDAITYPDPGGQDDPYVDPDADGYRLPTGDEWELAARYFDDANDDNDITDAGEYFPGDHVSGDMTGYCYPDDSGTSTVFGDYAVYDGNSDSSTAAVKSKLSNMLGLYDMSGNVREWSINWVTGEEGSFRLLRGGCWDDYAGSMPLGMLFGYYPYDAEIYNGFRVVCNY